ncbi:MAG: septation protein SepH [Candidatus Nanopelagicales bacterium]
MRELQFERLSEDGTHFVLVDSRGVQYSLLVDESLAASARRGLQRTAVKTAPGTITPRDIQALIRKGLSIDAVAAQTGLTIDFVQRFAEPVMAEMDFVVQRARRLFIYAAGQQIPVEELVDRASRRADVPAEELEWSCRKTEDATWRIEASAAESEVLALVFRVSEGTVTPADASTADLLHHSGRVVDLPDTPLVSRSLPQHWDAEHPAAKAAARTTRPEPAQPVLNDDPSRIF